MGLPRSTFYDVPAAPVGDVELVAKIVVICDEFETYGYRRVRAELRHQGFVVNGKKIRRLMRENGLQPKRRKSSSPSPLAVQITQAVCDTSFKRVSKSDISQSLH